MTLPRSHRHRHAVLGLMCLAVLAASPAPAARAAQPGNPRAGGPWYVDDETLAAQAQRAAAAAGQTGQAMLLGRIAQTPQSMWFVAADAAQTGYVGDFWSRADAAIAAAPQTIVTITLHGLPSQVCAGDNAPGAAGAAEYRSYIDGWASLIGQRRVVVFLEPDALAAAICLSPAGRAERLALMRYAARTLSALPHVGVYEDAGAGDWRPVREMARMLRAAGVGFIRGFTLNTTHYDWTGNEIAYGLKLSRLLGGAHFVVNTAFNGRGPQLRANGSHEWCNPSGRALGPLPTTHTPSPRIDAFYWLGNPGLSDGTCHGGPRVGQFWEPWALGLASRAGGAPDYPVYRTPPGRRPAGR